MEQQHKRLEMENAAKIIENRIDVIESTFFTGKKCEDPLGYPIKVVEKMQNINARVTAMEEEIPNVPICSNLITEIRPYISQRKTSLNNIVERVDDLMNKRKEILQFVDDLTTIQKLSQYTLNGEEFIDIEMLQNKISFFDNQLQPLIMEVAAQSQMLDELLDAYERAMLLVSETSLELTRKIHALH
jgi:hypothetical protein